MAGAVFPHRDGRCERAHQWSSLRLDGELSDLENALLERHLEGCAACRAFDRQVASTAHALRTAPLESAPARFELPARRRSRVPVGRAVAAAAVVAAAAMGSLVGSTLNRPAPEREQPVTQVSLLTRDADRDQLRQLPRNGGVTPTAPTRELGGPPEGII
jgi:anti-sigma factor RsiW